MNIMNLTPGKGIIITTEGHLAEVETTLDQLQAAVGGYVERIILDDGKALWVNEEGKINGLDWNPVGQSLFEMTYGPQVDIIVGNVVLTLDTE